MKVHNVEQRSVEWLQLRAGIPTASEFSNLLTGKLEPRKGQMVQSYLCRKIGEWWFGGVLPGFNSYDTDVGEILEGEAKPFYSFEYGVEIQQVGFITNDENTIGCSPDGLFSDGTGIEIKCPNAQTHFGYLLDGGLPEDYGPQVHGTMYVTGAPRWTFMSYHRRTPAHVLDVERDEAVQSRIGEALAAFLAKFEKAKARLIEINGGPPRRATPKPAPTPTPDPEYVDLIP